MEDESATEELVSSTIEESTIDETACEEWSSEQTTSKALPLSSSSSVEEHGARVKRRRKQTRKVFIEGKARKPYRVCKNLRRSL